MTATQSDSRNSGTPWLQPEWRWEQVCRIVKEARYVTKRHDPVIRRTVYCQRLLRRATTQRGARSAAKKYPDIFMALKFYNEDSLRPLEVKARVLAGQTGRMIARVTGLTVPIVAAYTDLFYDVRDRLNASTWIRWVAIGLPLTGAPSVETLALLHAWRRGPAVVEPWLDYMQHQGETHDLTTEIGRQRASIALLVAVHQLPDDAEARRSLAKKFPFVALKVPEIANSVSIAGVFSRNASQMTGEFAWNEPEEGVFFGGAAAAAHGKPHGEHQDWGFAKAG